MTQQNRPHLDGLPVTIHGEQFIVAPLTLRLLRTYEDRITALSSPDGSYIQKMLNLTEPIAACLRRPDGEPVTVDDVEALLDVASFNRIWKAMMTATGLEHAPAGEA